MTMFTKTETVTRIDYRAIAKAAMNAELSVADSSELQQGTHYCKNFDESPVDQQDICVEIVKNICAIAYKYSKGNTLFYSHCVDINNDTWKHYGWKYGKEFNITHKTDNTLVPYVKMTDNQKLQAQVFADIVWNIVRSLPLEVFSELKP